MEPYHRTGLGRLYREGAAEVIDSLAREGTAVQMAFADPPYNAGKADWDEFETREAYLDWVAGWVDGLGGLLDPDGSAFVMGFSETLAHVKCRLDAACDWIDSTRWLVWHYRNKPRMDDDGWTRSHESLLWLRKPEHKFRMDRVRVPYNDHTERYPVRDQGASSRFGSEEGYTWDPNVEGAKPRDVIDVPTVNNASAERTDHPTQKPEELLRKLVWATTDRGDRVLDPFGGSGTTYAVCEQLGREWVGAEVDGGYCALIRERLEGIEPREDPAYWMEHDLERREHRRRIRYGDRSSG